MKDMEKAPSINQSLGWQPHSAIEACYVNSVTLLWRK